jgi:hypothetical protein
VPSFYRASTFQVVVTSCFGRRDYKEFLKAMMPIEKLQPVLISP